MKSKGRPNLKAIDRVHMRELEQSQTQTIQQRINSCAEELKKEFHARLKREVAKITCDVPKTKEEFDAILARYSDNKYKDDLLVILWKEMLQVIRAVEEAK